MDTTSPDPGQTIWHDEADRLATWGTLDPPDACMCRECVLSPARNDCPHENTRMESETVGQGIYRHLVRREICTACGQVVALW